MTIINESLILTSLKDESVYKRQEKLIYDHLQVTNMSPNGYNLPETVVLDCLEAINQATTRPIVVGGIAASLYLYPQNQSFLRKTKDLDTSIGKYLTRSEANNSIVGPIASYIVNKGYSPEVKTPHHFYGVEVLPETAENGPFYVSLPRRSRETFEKHVKRIMREVENVQEVRIPERQSMVQVIRPEDIIAPKLLRRKDKDILDIFHLSRATEINNDYLRESLTYFGAEGELLDDLYKLFLKIAQKI